MNLLDGALLAVMVSAALGGYRVGVIAGGTAWVLLVQGLVLATMVIPTFSGELAELDAGMALILAIVFFVLCGFGGHHAGLRMGTALRRHLASRSALRADRPAGAVGGPVAVLLAAWLLVVPTVERISGDSAGLLDGSLLARALEAALPEPPDSSQVVRRLAGPAASPQVFHGLLPSLETGPPPAESGLPPDVVRRVAASTVRVEGTACLSEREGSGFTVAPDVVVTNAHVVAGQRRTTVTAPDGRRLPAVVAVFDTYRDLALLRVPSLGQAPLPLGEGLVGSTVAVFGHPGGQPTLRVAPASIRQELGALGRDLYGTRLVRRRVLVLAARLEPGDSGAALVDVSGRVVGVAFAVSPDSPTRAYALSTSELRPLLSPDPAGRAETGPCLLGV